MKSINATDGYNMRPAFIAGAKWAIENQIDPDRYDAAYMDGYAQGTKDNNLICAVTNKRKKIVEATDD